MAHVRPAEFMCDVIAFNHRTPEVTARVALRLREAAVCPQPHRDSAVFGVCGFRNKSALCATRAPNPPEAARFKLR